MRKKILKLLIGVVAGLSLAEALLRITPRSVLPNEFRVLDRAYTGRARWERMTAADAYLGYKYKPELDLRFPSEGREIRIRTVSYGLGEVGFRDIGARPPFDAVAIGDSYAFCDDVPAENCWVRHLSEITGLSIASLGVGGYSTLAEARLLDRYGRALRPRLILLTVFPNDFNDNLAFERWSRSASGNFWQWRAQREGRRGRFGRWFADHLKIYRMIDGLLRTTGAGPYKYKDRDLDLVLQPRWIEPTDAERAREREYGWQLMQRALLQVRDIAEELRARLVVVLIPTKEEVYWPVVDESLAGAGDDGVPYSLGAIPEFCRQNGLECCDLRPALRSEAERRRQLYLRISNHWNDDGNAFGALAISRCLTERGIVTPSGVPSTVATNGHE